MCCVSLVSVEAWHDGTYTRFHPCFPGAASRISTHGLISVSREPDLFKRAWCETWGVEPYGFGPNEPRYALPGILRPDAPLNTPCGFPAHEQQYVTAGAIHPALPFGCANINLTLATQAVKC